jgi:hypothetical protein
MSDLKHAQKMLAMAEKDLKALPALLQEDLVAVEIFGFHA